MKAFLEFFSKLNCQKLQAMILLSVQLFQLRLHALCSSILIKWNNFFVKFFIREPVIFQKS